MQTKNSANLKKNSANLNKTFSFAEQIKNMKDLIIRQINITEIKVSGYERYSNGEFIPMFIDVLLGLAKDSSIKPTTLRVLLFVLTIVDKNNYVRININEIAEEMGFGKTSVYNAIGSLITMNILCNDTNHRSKVKGKFKLNLYVLNPRVGYRGNTRKINKHLAPAVMQPDGLTPLLPSTKREFEYIDFYRDEQV